MSIFGPTPHEPHGTVDREPYRVLDDDGHLLPDAAPPEVPDDDLLSMYEEMRFARHFDERAVSLQRQGRIATYAPMAGQEAAQVASAYALADRDWLVPTYRDHAAKVVRGVAPGALLALLRGHTVADAFPEDANVLPEYIPIATQIPQAMGLAWASKLAGDSRVTLCYFGDGATSEGDFHEGLNFAGVFDVPAVFFCNNNQWAISVPQERQTASETIAQKAVAYGFEGVRIDGMDPLAVYEATQRAVEKAQTPGPGELRPTLIEAVQYRLGAHTTADDPTVYRDEREVDRWRERDPLDRFETFLRRSNLLDDDREQAISIRVETRMREAIEAAEAVGTDPSVLFDHVYEGTASELLAQRDELARLRETHGDGAFREDDA